MMQSAIWLTAYLSKRLEEKNATQFKVMFWILKSGTTVSTEKNTFFVWQELLGEACSVDPSCVWKSW